MSKLHFTHHAPVRKLKFMTHAHLCLFVTTVRIRLARKNTGRIGSFSCTKRRKSRRSDVASNAKQRAECVEQVEAAIEAESLFAGMSLQMLRADAVVNASEPCLEIGEHEVSDGQEGLDNLHVPSFRDGGTWMPSFAKRRVSAPVFGEDGGAWRNDTYQRFGTSVWHHREPSTTTVLPSSALVETASALGLFDLDRAGDENHVVNTSSLTAGTATDVISSTSTCSPGLPLVLS